MGKQAHPDSWKDPAEAVPVGRGGIPPAAASGQPLRHDVLPGSGRLVAASLNTRFPRSQAARGWDLGLGPGAGPPRAPSGELAGGWGRRPSRWVKTRYPNTDETSGDRVGVGEMEPLGRG